jgi:hypothetical protein
MFYITFLEGSSEMLELKNDVNKLAKFDLVSEPAPGVCHVFLAP